MFEAHTTSRGREITEGRKTAKDASLASLFGLTIGCVAGLIGVGGGEFRIPVLLHILRLSAVTAVTVNLFVGLLVVVASFFRRLQLGLLSSCYANIAFAMSVSSIVGAYVGARLSGKLPEKTLRKFLAAFLVIIGLKIGIEPFVELPAPFTLTLDFAGETILSVIIGLTIGIVSGYFGVAGGEFRIPALIYIFGIDVVDAGTLSLLVSIPTVSSGLLKHHRMGHFNRGAFIIAIAMGTSSVVGASIGASFVGAMDKDLLKVLLGVILVSSTIRIVTKP
ncbi:MAG: sulfite exporter TauE/SafE family protein [Candidatus Nezhaarchaeales archaeon]